MERKRKKKKKKKHNRKNEWRTVESRRKSDRKAFVSSFSKGYNLFLFLYVYIYIYIIRVIYVYVFVSSFNLRSRFCFYILFRCSLTLLASFVFPPFDSHHIFIFSRGNLFLAKSVPPAARMHARSIDRTWETRVHTRDYIDVKTKYQWTPHLVYIRV